MELIAFNNARFNGLFPGHPERAGTRVLNCSGVYCQREIMEAVVVLSPRSSQITNVPVISILQALCHSCHPSSKHCQQILLQTAGRQRCIWTRHNTVVSLYHRQHCQQLLTIGDSGIYEQDIILWCPFITDNTVNSYLLLETAMYMDQT